MDVSVLDGSNFLLTLHVIVVIAIVMFVNVYLLLVMIKCFLLCFQCTEEDNNVEDNNSDLPCDNIYHVMGA